ncbi:MAG UNVERIFIED_CONTAM: hypothetical protein LVR29_19105 [Microcystis novacekii LVE1205-3]|jgi:alpha-amylase/alpha-mannosidase (GH57 family)
MSQFPPICSNRWKNTGINKVIVLTAFIHPIIDGFGDEQDWDKAGRIEIGGASGTMHRASLVQRLFFGWDHLNFYLRFDWKPGAELGKNIPPEVHLYWYYDEVHRLQSPIPLADIPLESPLDYGYHHHLGVNLITGIYLVRS